MSNKPNRNTKDLTQEELDTFDYMEAVEYVDGHSSDRDLQYYLPL